MGYNAVNINRITLPNEDNGVTNITVEKINSQTEIKGVATNACVDVFGNFYINVADSIEGENQKLIKYSNGVTTELATTNKKFISFKADFAGNVYGLANDGLIYKYSYNALNNDLSIFKLDTELPIKNIDLNYRSNVCYALSNACILNSKGDVMNIANLSEVGKANALNTVLDKVEGKFVTIDKNAKLFKVTLGDYTESGNFKTITPVTNPYPEKVYLVIDEIDNYYLVSCFDKFVALVRKTETKYSPDSNFTLAIIGEDYYDAFKISVNEVNETFVISNQTTVFAKPIFSQNYALQTIDKNTSVKALLEVKFNGVSMTLITTSEDNEPLGFIVSGYLNGELESTVTTTTNKTAIVSSDGKKHFNTVLMITIIAFTLTFVALFIEKKLLFDKEDGNKN
ncbi:MAG: hypothetical protein J6V66_04950 [Clostridia bacterium]|nr:hypothetical protein [Clostridia bacterium]